MKRRNGSSPTRRDLLAVAKFAEVFAPGSTAGRWNVEPGTLPRLEPARDVAAFVVAVYKRGVMLSSDWPAWQDAADRVESDDDLVATADLETIRRLITRAVRQDRFGEGVLAAWIASRGQRVLRRLEQLARET